jgi:hypothetical protein
MTSPLVQIFARSTAFSSSRTLPSHELPRSTFSTKTHEEIRRLREESRATLRAAIEEVVEEWPAYG